MRLPHWVAESGRSLSTKLSWNDILISTKSASVCFKASMNAHAFVQLPVGSYPTPFLGYLLFYTTDPNHKTMYPKKGLGYEPLGTVRQTADDRTEQAPNTSNTIAKHNNITHRNITDNGYNTKQTQQNKQTHTHTRNNHANMHTCMDAYMHTYLNTYTHTCTQDTNKKTKQAKSSEAQNPLPQPEACTEG